jgi:AcrR family transcriptional regulator
VAIVAVSAAEAMVLASGQPAVLSLRGVAARVGVATTSVYLHVPDLQAIKVALAQRGFAAFTTERGAAVAAVDDPVESLTAGCRTYVRWALDHPGLYRLMFSADLPLLIADLTGPSRSAFDALVAAAERCQASGRATGQERDTYGPQWTATLLWSALHGQLYLRLDRPQFP